MKEFIAKSFSSTWISVLLFASYPVLFLFARNRHEVAPSTAWLMIAIVTGIALSLTLILSKISRDPGKARFLVIFWLLVFFSYGHVFNLLQTHVTEEIHHRFLWPLWVMLMIGGSRALLRLSKLPSQSQVLNIVGAALVASNISHLLVRTDFSWITPTWVSNEVSGSIENKPDIYYIVLDGYANPTTLREIYGYDPTSFLSSLETMGFVVKKNSFSNYAMTNLSLSSALNMSYLQAHIKEPSTNTEIANLIVQKLYKNKVVSFLKAHGYSFINVGSTYYLTAKIPTADESALDNGNIAFQFLLINSTMLKPFGMQVAVRNSHQHILDTFEYLDKLGEKPRPKFVFSHIIAPHPPYLFAADGSIKTDSEYAFKGFPWKDKKAYIDQMKFINDRVLLSIQRILSNSKTSPVIILQSDHGPASEFNMEYFEPIDKVTDNMLRERMRILNAYYLPGMPANTVPKEISPVNSFCLVFRAYFNQQCEMHENRSYYSTYNDIYPFHDVTTRVKW